MRKSKRPAYSFEHIHVLRHLLKWTALSAPVAVLVGAVVALFLWSLERATLLRWRSDWLLWLLPVAGVGIHFLYTWWGKGAGAGNDLIVDEIHEPGGGVPARMAPLVVVSTVITHLFGGSAGREGTAVQVGGSMANLLGRWYKLDRHDLRILLTTGIAAGFGAVFGTPVAGAIFALEVLAIGRIQYDALIPCLIASVIANATCGAFGIEHTRYTIQFAPGDGGSFGLLQGDVLLLAKVVLAGTLFGLAGYLFVQLSHGIKRMSARLVQYAWSVPVLGACALIGLTHLLGTTDYLGLGVTTADGSGVSITGAFHADAISPLSWSWKLLFTAITLGTGFKGGEVTPLFFIGATLGHTLAAFTGAPIDLFAGLGFIAVFAGATNTPLACTLMGVELFGGEHTLYYAVACFTAYYFSGHSGIYTAQRLAVTKHGGRTPHPAALRRHDNTIDT